MLTAPDFPILKIDHPLASASIAQQGAHLIEWTPAGHAPVLYVSPTALFQKGKAIRGGVPICWPWFGPHPSDATMPAHGLVRGRPWQLVSHHEDETGAHLTYRFVASEETTTLWPQPFSLILEMHLGKELQLSLHTENTGTSAFPLTSALHTYLAVSDLRTVTVKGLDGVPYHEAITQPPDHLQSGDVIIDREVDRIYATGGPLVLHDPTCGRKIVVRSAGSQSCVVWNPWTEKSKSLTDLPDEDYLRFLCLETTNAGADVITLAAGESHTLTVNISVSSP